MDPNDYQVGGDHYKKEYQHWDMVCDINLHYLLGCATKYVSRWRDKNGLQDLKKALHYIDKFEDVGLHVNVYNSFELSMITKFCDQHKVTEVIIIRYILIGSMFQARRAINELIEENISNPEYFKG